jgi:hypothetical protein
MKNMFKNPWANCGEMFPDWMGDFRENIMQENDVYNYLCLTSKS